jgi:serine/threonine-protein kinase
MGVVYKGTNEKSGRPAAVKVVNTEYAQGGKIRDRFDREAKILQQFRHPNIVRFLAVGRFRGTSYIAMEYIQGVTLEATIAEKGGVPWREMVDLGIQICEALHYAHERGVVHRDLKPSNLMFTADGKIKLTDFGIAKDLDATAITATDRTLGTAAYMSPEQIRGKPPVSHKTDLYALGIVFYQMLTSKPPFEGGTPVVLMHSHLNEPAPRPSTKVHEIPKVLDDLIVNLMAKAPSDRPWDAAAVGAILSELRDKANRGASIPMVFPSSSPRSGKPSRGVAADSSIGSAASAEPSRKKSRKSGTSAFFPGRGIGAAEAGFPWISRGALETGLLVTALVTIGGFIVYWVYPPSAGYLYRQAEALMISTRRADWQTAVEEYLNPLDKRFPDNPYREQTQQWRDKLLLDDAENRAKVLTSGLNIRMAEPNNNAERRFLVAHAVAQQASNRGDDRAAIRPWQELAEELKSDPDERLWHLLALHRVAQLENVIKVRRETVEKLQAEADAARLAGRFEDADTIKARLKEQYSKYTDLADVFPPPENPPDSDAKKKNAPEPPTDDSKQPDSPKPPKEGPQPESANPPSSPEPGEKPEISSSDPMPIADYG